jgi:hypothetical protein
MEGLELAASVSYVPIDKDAVPYEFSLKLWDRTYRFLVKYNTLGDFFTLDLSTAQGELLCRGDPVRYGRPCFESVSDENFPLPLIVPLSMALDGAVSEANWDTVGSQVKLCLFQRPEPDPGDGAR